MWLLLRGRSARAALDLDGGRIWSTVEDPVITIDLPDGRLSIAFPSAAKAAVAAEHLLQAIRERKEVIDTEDGQWDKFSAEWTFFDPQRQDQESDTPSYQQEIELQSDSWEPTPPTDPRLRRLWEKAEPVRGVLRPKQADVEQIILDICRGQFLSSQEIATVLDRSPTSVRAHFLNPLVNAGRLKKEFPDHRNHPRQRYRTASQRSAKG